MAMVMYILLTWLLLQDNADAWFLRRDEYLTYNTALLDFPILPGQTTNTRVERRDAMIAALNESPANVVCLQEVWIGQDVEAIVGGVQNKFPYSYSVLHDDDGNLPPQQSAVQDPPCDSTLLEAFRQCAENQGCLGLPVELQGPCGVQNCQAEFGALFPSNNGICVTCLFTNLFNNVNEVIASCTAPGPAVGLRTINNPGLLVLSNRRLSDMSYTRYHQEPALVERGFLEFTYRGKTKVACTHLTTTANTGFSEPVLGQIFPNSADQNRFQSDILVDRFGDECPVVVLGDMNVGASRPPDITEVEPANYYALIDGFRSTRVSVDCTFCEGSENFYNSDEMGENSVIDHIMGNGMVFVSGKTVFTTADNNITDSGQTVPLSDHYGYLSASRFIDNKWLNRWLGLCPSPVG